MEYGEALDRMHILRPVIAVLPGTSEGLRSVGTEPGGYARVSRSVAHFWLSLLIFYATKE